MSYKYELHCHTALSSLCASASAEELVKMYLANGYSGVFITDHFLNGNACVNRDLPNGSYEERVEAFARGYRAVKAAAGEKLDIFFGFEYSYKGTDVLVYGWDIDRLKKLDSILDMSMREFCDYCKENGALAVQAHPFREDSYIDHIRLYPNVEGVEVFNAGRTEKCNELGRCYAEICKKVKTAGSDLHHVSQKTLGGMIFEEKIASEQQFVKLIREGKGKIFQTVNVYKNNTAKKYG